MIEQAGEVAVVDFDEALENLEGDVELLQDVVEIFMERGQEQLAAIRQAITDADVQTVMIQSHGMKGGSSNFCAKRFGKAALALEMLSKGGSLEGAEEMLDLMVEEFGHLGEKFAATDWEALATAQIV